MGHGRALINVYEQEKQLEIYQKILKDKLSVRQTEQLVKNLRDGKSLHSERAVPKEIPDFAKHAMKGMSTYLGQKIDIKVSGKEKGKIIIPFHSEEDFMRIKKLLE